MCSRFVRFGHLVVPNMLAFSPSSVVQHTAPIAFATGTGVNDELDGSESKAPVKFSVPNQYIPRGIKPKPESELTPEEREEANKYRMECEVMQSLAKWKRIMLGRLGVDIGQGIYCSSTSIRKGYKGDVTHVSSLAV